MAIIYENKYLTISNGTLFIQDENTRLRCFENDRAALMFLSYLEMDFNLFLKSMPVNDAQVISELIDFDYLLNFLISNGTPYWLEKLLFWIVEGNISLSETSLGFLKSLLSNRSYPQKVRHTAKKIMIKSQK